MGTKLFSWYLVAGIFMCQSSIAQETRALWAEGEAPFSKDNDLVEYEEETWDTLCAFNVTKATLTVYPATGENTGKAVLVIPGGGYSLVAVHHEGHDIAKLLAERGISAAVLKYRLPNPKSSDNPELVPLADTRRALHLFRTYADELGFNAQAVGVMGFSAGSHLATVAGLWPADAEDERPNFSALIYGVTDLNEDNKSWLEESLYYRPLTKDEIKQNTLLKLVTENTPPAFMVHSYDDDVCKVEETTLYAEKLRQHGVAAEAHLFTKGGHGFGAGRKEDGTDQWIDLFASWLSRMDF